MKPVATGKVRADSSQFPEYKGLDQSNINHCEETLEVDDTIVCIYIYMYMYICIHARNVFADTHMLLTTHKFGFDRAHMYLNNFMRAKMVYFSSSCRQPH